MFIVPTNIINRYGGIAIAGQLSSNNSWHRCWWCFQPCLVGGGRMVWWYPHDLRNLQSAKGCYPNFSGKPRPMHLGKGKPCHGKSLVAVSAVEIQF